MEVEKRVAIISRKEAVKRAVDFLKKTKKPNIASKTDLLAYGLGSFVMFGSGDTKYQDQVYFPMDGDSNQNHSKCSNMQVVPLTDRLELFGFLDHYYEDILVDVNEQEQVCYFTVFSNKVCGCLSFNIFNNFKSVEQIVRHIKEKTDEAFMPMLSDITNEAFGNKSEVTKPEAPKIDPVTFNFMDIKNVTRIELRDRVDFMHFYDSHINNNLISVDVQDSSSRHFVATQDNIVGSISPVLMSKSASVKTIVNSFPGNWTATKERFFDNA